MGEMTVRQAQETEDLMVRGMLRAVLKQPEERLITSVQGAKGAEQLHTYWTKGEGLAKWAKSPKPWTALFHHLFPKYIQNEDKAKRTAAAWFFDVFHFWPGSDKNRVLHGKPPRGSKVGPG